MFSKLEKEPNTFVITQKPVLPTIMEKQNPREEEEKYKDYNAMQVSAAFNSDEEETYYNIKEEALEESSDMYTQRGAMIRSFKPGN